MSPRLQDDTPPALHAPTSVGPFAVGGTRFCIVADEPDVAIELAAALTDLLAGPGTSEVTFTVARREPPSRTHPWEVWRDAELCERVTDDYLVPYVLWEVTRLLLEHAEGVTPVHAAAVARGGRAIVLAGESHAGKSTLAGWLTAHGWDFLTDEVALVGRRGSASWWVSPFSRPIGVRHPSPLDPFLSGSARGRPESLVPASRLGRLSPGAPLAAIILPRHRPGSAGAVASAHPASAVRALFEHLPLRRQRGREGFRDVVDLALSVPAFTLEVDDLPTADATLTTLLGGVGP